MNKFIQTEKKINKEARGKKIRNAGYQPTNHWLACDICGFLIRAKDAREVWNGLWVCPQDWEIRHPQDFVRGRVDDTSPTPPVRPENVDTFAPKRDDARTPEPDPNVPVPPPYIP